MVALQEVASLIAAATAWTLALTVLATSPRYPIHRALAAALAIEGVLQATSLLPEAGPSWGPAAREIVFLAGLPALPWLYLLLVSRFDARPARLLARARPFFRLCAGAAQPTAVYPSGAGSP